MVNIIIMLYITLKEKMNCPDLNFGIWTSNFVAQNSQNSICAAIKVLFFTLYTFFLARYIVGTYLNANTY